MLKIKSWIKAALAVPAHFGPDTMTLGNCKEKLTIFNGIRVNSRFGKGTIYNVLINQKSRLIQVWVNMDSGGARCFRPRQLSLVCPPRLGKWRRLIQWMNSK